MREPVDIVNISNDRVYNILYYNIYIWKSFQRYECRAC